MNIANEEAAMLWRLAEQDRLAFQTLCANPAIEFRIAGFHGQQAVEKYLKAILVVRGTAFTPTHDVVKLALLIGAAGAGLPVSLDALKRINPYAVMFRYDDRDIHTVTRDEAMALIGAVANWAGSLLTG
jgi:HEPN domain-containing protein